MFSCQAFNAPLLAHIPSNCSGKEIARLENIRKVKYGASNHETGLDESSGEKIEKLVIDETRQVREPAGQSVSLKEHRELLVGKLRTLRHKREEV